MTNEQQGPTAESVGKMFNVMLSSLAILVLKFMAKAFVVMFLYNLVIPEIFQGAKVLEYGHAFVLTALVTLLFGTFEPQDKRQSTTLLDLKVTMAALLYNQAQQNSTIINILFETLKRVDKMTQSGQNDLNGHENVTILDETVNTDYNTEQSPEKKE